MEKLEVKTTEEIRTLNAFVCQLRRELPKVMSQKLWEAKLSIKEKLEFIKFYSEMISRLLALVEGTYPEFKGRNYEIDDIKIKTID